VDGDTAVVGAALDDLNGNNAGAAYVYVKAGGLWTLQAEVTAPDGAAGDEFGFRVAIDGDTMIVGAWLDDTVSGLRAGSAYVFVRSGQEWTLQAKLRPSNSLPNDRFGLAVDVDGDTIVVGSGHDLQGPRQNYVFQRNGSTWSEETQIPGGAGTFRTLFLSGDRVVIAREGAYARVHRRTGTTWALEAQLEPASPLDPGWGYWVAIEDDLLVILDRGAPALIYEFSGGAWAQTAQIAAPLGTSSYVTGVSNGRILVSYRWAHPSAAGPKASRVYERDSTSWIEVAALLPAGATPFFGYSAAISGNEVVIGSFIPGAPGEAHAFTFEDVFSPFCDASDGALASCPCANPGSPDTGCDIQQGTGGVRLDITGMALGPPNSATAVGTGYPPTFTPGATLVRSSNLHASGTVVFGDGVFCLANPVVRVGGAIAINGQTTHVFGHGAMAGSGTFYYQLHYRNTPAMFCTPDAFNLSSGRAIVW
jgi:hypothetical protein